MNENYCVAKIYFVSLLVLELSKE